MYSVPENNVVENPPRQVQEAATTSVRTDIKQEARDEPRTEQPVTSPSMKPPPEKKSRLA